MLLAARDPSANRSLIGFTACSSFAHAALMAVQAFLKLIARGRVEKLSFVHRLRTIQGGFSMQRHNIAFTICLGLGLMLVSSAALAQYQL